MVKRRETQIYAIYHGDLGRRGIQMNTPYGSLSNSREPRRTRNVKARITVHPNWPGACPMLLVEPVIFNHIRDSHRHVLIIDFPHDQDYPKA